MLCIRIGLYTYIYIYIFPYACATAYICRDTFMYIAAWILDNQADSSARIKFKWRYDMLIIILFLPDCLCVNSCLLVNNETVQLVLALSGTKWTRSIYDYYTEEREKERERNLLPIELPLVGHRTRWNWLTPVGRLASELDQLAAKGHRNASTTILIRSQTMRIDLNNSGRHTITQLCFKVMQI